MPKNTDDGTAIPLKVDEQAPEYPDGVALSIPTDVPQPDGTGAKSGQTKAATPKEN